jgi:hypothetical protein
MKKFALWSLAFIITLSAAVYQKYTGPTYPKRVNVTVNDKQYKLKLIRTLALDETSEVKLKISDPSIKAKIYFKRFRSNDEYQVADFIYTAEPKKEGYSAVVPQQPAAGKLQYYVEISDSKDTKTYLKENPVVIRFKGGVPAYILIPHILCMFIAMLFSTLAGLMAAVKFPLYKKYALWTLILFVAGGFILGPIVQNYAFGELWTGIPFGWDLTDNKTLIALVFWVLAVIMNLKKERPFYTILAAIILLLVFSIPHSLFGSELNITTGQVTQGIILNFF